jgi:plastocyanin
VSRFQIAAGAALCFLLAAGTAAAQDAYVLTLKDHKFEPAQLEIPAGQEVTITVKNTDGTPEEFESETLDVEEVIGGGQEASFKIGPLEAGTYEFVGEFNEDTAKGVVVVK